MLGDWLFVDAVIFHAKTGIPWRGLTERFGKWKSVYNRFRNWSRNDVWTQIFRELRIDVDETASIADGSVVRAHQDASGGKGGSKTMLWDALVEFSDQISRNRRLERSPGPRHADARVHLPMAQLGTPP